MATKEEKLLELKAEASDLGIPFDDSKANITNLTKLIKDFKASAEDGTSDEIAEDEPKETKKVLGIEKCEALQKEGWAVKEVSNTEDGKEYLLVK